ncbi:phospholipase A and acyltransferase 1-like [Antedon mediterranea]|uniref:phospholipase A and acyltransferase 1-like n=1 Tax=Antedon mediterranea TaxID=105859 RepID=UPI003AF71C67
MYPYNLQAGDIVTVKRTSPFRPTYYHYGVYIGNGEVIHLSGAEFNIKAKETAKVHRVTFKEFVGDDDDNPEVECIPCPFFVNRQEVVRLAKSAEGDFFRNRKYDLFFNNCEHFARWCHGDSESKQVQKVVKGAIVGGAVALGVGLLIREVVKEIKEEKKQRHYHY